MLLYKKVSVDEMNSIMDWGEENDKDFYILNAEEVLVGEEVAEIGMLNEDWEEYENI